MNARAGLIVALTVLAVASGAVLLPSPAGSGQGASDLVLGAPAKGRVYHAAFPDFGGPESRVSAARIRSFERLAKRRIAWAYFSNNWLRGRVRFPARHVRQIERAGRVPFIRIMARSGFGAGPDPHFKMRSIAGGAWDSELTEWCSRARDAGIPLLAEFGTEVNGDWFPWNGRWNGGGADQRLRRPAVGGRPGEVSRRVSPHRRHLSRRGRQRHHLVLPRRRRRLAEEALEQDRRLLPGRRLRRLDRGQRLRALEAAATVGRLPRGDSTVPTPGSRGSRPPSRSRCSSTEPRRTGVSRGTRPAGSGARSATWRPAAGRASGPSPTGTSSGETRAERCPTCTSTRRRAAKRAYRRGLEAACSRGRRDSWRGNDAR